MIQIINAVEAANVDTTIANLIVTHNGVFHGDDVMAVAILSLFTGMTNKSPDTYLVRTRNAELATMGVAVDVGGLYEPAVNRFDHHQRDFSERRDSGVKYASAGLVWLKYGKIVIELHAKKCGVSLSIKDIDKIFSIIDSEVMEPIDAIDNGESIANGLSFSHFISSFNTNWNEDMSLSDERFMEAMKIAEDFLVRKIDSNLSLSEAGSIVESSEIIEDGQVLVLPRFCPWIRPVFELGLDALLFGVYESQDGTWMVQAIPPEPNSFEKRKALPASWAGLRGDEFCVAADVADAVFCHPGAFLCGAKSKAGALKLASLALKS